MSDERRDDEIIGRALSRAIETIDVNQTPFERSRIAAAPARRSIFGLWQMATAVAAIVFALAIGSWLTRPTEGQPGVAASPTAPAATSSAATPTPAATASPAFTPAPTAVDHDKIYLARPSLPPIAVSWLMFGGTVISPGERIAARLHGLPAYQPSAAPPGLINYLGKNNLQDAARVTIAGDLATVDLHLGAPLNASDHAEAVGILQQLVYTATEEPGIHRVLFTQNGGQQLSIGDIRVDKPLAREDVFGYSFRAPLGKDQGITWGGDDSVPHVGASMTGYTNDGSRVVVTLKARGPNGETANLPSFSAWLEQSDDTTKTSGKYGLYVQLQWNGGGSSNGAAAVTIPDQTPLRAVTTNGNNVFRIELDDARPWRAYMPDQSQLVIDIGGAPQATSESVAVYAPKPGETTGRTLTVSGAARAFEAHVVWRVKDSSGRVVANGFTLASISGAVWGTFQTSVTIPANVSGNVTLEVFWPSPKDGTELGLVQVPLAVR